jgi:hypothetical protein
MSQEIKEKLRYYSIEKLKEIVSNAVEYKPELVEAAIFELKNRKVEIDDIQLTTQEEIEELSNSPILYSPRVIMVFSVLFSGIFGSLMFGRNLSVIKNRKGYWINVLIFIAMFASYFIIMSNEQGNLNGFLAIIANFFWGVLYSGILWGVFIGTDLKFKKKSYSFPAIIGILINLLLFLANT